MEGGVAKVEEVLGQGSGRVDVPDRQYCCDRLSFGNERGKINKGNKE
jgi:hypothetical protein